MIRIEVAYALPEEQFLVELEMDDRCSVLDAVRESGLLERFPELAESDLALGIFSRPTTPDAGLVDGDRVEIYRPLTIDPKEARRLRAKAKKKK